MWRKATAKQLLDELGLASTPHETRSTSVCRQQLARASDERAVIYSSNAPCVCVCVCVCGRQGVCRGLMEEVDVMLSFARAVDALQSCGCRVKLVHQWL